MVDPGADVEEPESQPPAEAEAQAEAQAETEAPPAEVSAPAEPEEQSAPVAADETTRVHEVPSGPEPESVVEIEDGARQSKRLFRRRRGRPFIDRPGKCAVCSTEAEFDGEAELVASGWIVRDQAAVCPTCQADGWQFPDGAALPFRQGAEQHA
jgi:hypothetical protein